MISDIELLTSGAINCFTKERLREKLDSGRKLIVKLGFDPTAPDLHLGHSVVLNKLAQFQALGHNVVVVIGGFTAMIGDPTGRNKLRPVLSKKEVVSNAYTYVKQLSRILDISRIKVVNNAEWFSKMKYSQLIKILSHFTLSRVIQRNDFSDRIAHNRALYMHELIYPVMQAYDSYVIGADVELGGTDQLFNCLMGSDLQKTLGVEEQVVLCMPILVGTDGKEKMSKSKGNYIGLSETACNMYGKIMSIPDSLIYDYVSFVSFFDKNEKHDILNELRDNASCDFMSIKKRLAYNITKRYHSTQEARDAEATFERVVQNKEIKDCDYESVTVPLKELSSQNECSFLDLCAFIYKGVESRSAIKRLINYGAVRLNGRKVVEPTYKVNTLQDAHVIFAKRKAFIVRFT